MRLHEGDRLAAGGVTWVKACKCRNATASSGKLELRAIPGRDVVKIEAVYRPGLVCDECGTAWERKETKEDEALRIRHLTT